jgi:hypothetical protein
VPWTKTRGPRLTAHFNSVVIQINCMLSSITQTTVGTSWCRSWLMLMRTSSYLSPVLISSCCDAECYKWGGVPCLFQELRHTGLNLSCTMMYTPSKCLTEVSCRALRISSLHNFLLLVLFLTLLRLSPPPPPPKFSATKYEFQCSVFILRHDTFNFISPILNFLKFILCLLNCVWITKWEVSTISH